MNLGHTISDTEIKKGLKELNPGLHFDMGGKLDLSHPMMNVWQGVFLNGRHITSMDRGMVPEYKVWGMREEWNVELKAMAKVRDRPIRIGWRTTFERLVRCGVPGVNHETLADKFKVPVKRYNGPLADLEFDDIHNDTRRLSV